jgi:hypothetical protein
MKIFLIIIGSIIALFLITAGIFYAASRSAPITEAPPPATPPSAQPAPPEEPAPADEAPVQTGIDGFTDAAAEVYATGEPKELDIFITETEANQRAAGLVATLEIPPDIPLEIKSIHLDLQPDNIVLVEAPSTLFGRLSATVRVTTRVSIEAGEPKVEITKISFGLIPVPQSLKDEIDSLITEKLGDFTAYLVASEVGGSGEVSVEFQDISIRQDDLTVSVVVRPSSTLTP